MERADFVHMVRMSEHACAENSQAYRRSVAAFAALGYAWVLGCLLLSAAALVWVVPQLLHGRFRIGLLFLLLGAASLLWTSVRALWVRFEPPQGLEITAQDAPALFEALDRIRRKVHGPPLHAVYVDDAFNASIRQVPRYGLLGGSVNQLTIGLPLAMALDKPRFLAVLAHEYGHLRGDHGRFSAWIYRTRASWVRLHDGFRHDEGVVAVITQTFLNWYFPRFAAKTFALARQDEYEADRVAARLLGRDVVADALTEIEVKGAWLDDVFWAQHWRAAAAHALPVGPFEAMRRLLTLAPEPKFAQEALRQGMQRLSSVDDTHPVLRDRIDALTGARPVLPAWSERGALGLLGPKVSRWLAHFDQEWRKDHADGWKQHHAWLGRVRERAQALKAAMGSANAAELVEQASLWRCLDPAADVRALYELALQRSDEHAGALLGIVHCLPEGDREARLGYLERLWDAGAGHRWRAATLAVAELETQRDGQEYDAARLQHWRARCKQAEEAESRAWDELAEPPYLRRVSRHDLSAFELEEVQAVLARCQPVVRCWLMNKQLQEFAQRRAYLVVLEVQGVKEDECGDLCRWLGRRLDLPGPAAVVCAGVDVEWEELRRTGLPTVYPR